MALHVINEAKRCLQCKKPLCQKGCPISTDIPKFISLFLNNNIDIAGEELFANNPLSLVCSLICNHESQCEGNCILNKKGSPVHISSIEHYISENYFDKLSFSLPKKNNKRVAIIGSGPSGITIAFMLALKGYSVTIFEAKDKIGGVLRYGIPEFRLPKSILKKYKQKLISLGVKIRPNISVGAVFSIDDMFRDGYQSIFIGTGVWKPNSLKIKGETLGNVHYAINYLSNPDVCGLGEELIIIGAGNSAIDVARTALRKGVKKVTVFSRSDSATANKTEVEYAKIDGVHFEYNKHPVEILEDGVIFKDDITNREELVKSDSVIVAISQGPRDRIVSTTYGINTTDKGLVVVNENGVTTRAGVFASGDVVLGAKTVVEAVNFSKLVAKEMDDYMSKLDKE